jgi:hypothetical protein
MVMSRSNLHLLGQIALQEGFITPDQLEECLRLQDAAQGKTLGVILVEKGYLSPDRLQTLAEIQKRRFDALHADPSRGGLFGQLAVRHGYLTQNQLSQGLRQQELQARSGSSLQLGQILMRQGSLSLAGFLQVLQLQRLEVVKCPACDAFFDVSAARGENKFACSKCGTVVRIGGDSVRSK